MVGFRWLPDHHLGVATTLAYDRTPLTIRVKDTGADASTPSPHSPGWVVNISLISPTS